jgi:hypothetical protein
MHERHRCPATGKRRYRDHKEAVRAVQGARRSREEGNHRAMAVRAYRCWTCQGWHLTSQASRATLIDPAALMRTA